MSKNVLHLHDYPHFYLVIYQHMNMQMNKTCFTLYTAFL